jgi:hypothetical protein
MIGKILTIAVPAYQVEPYLRQCLDSFLDVDVHGLLEVIVIDDGSSDGTAEIASEYAKQWPGVFRLVTQENKGHGGAVNAGIDHATGKYFKVVDGDDWVEPSGLIRLLDALSETDVDVVSTDYYLCNHATRLKTPAVGEPFQGVRYGDTYGFEDVARRTFIKMHAITYRTALLKEHGMRLTEHCFYVDMEYTTYPMPRVKTVMFLKDTVYCYRLGLPSQSVSLERMQRQSDQHLRVIQNLLAFYSTLEADSACGAYVCTGINMMVSSQFKTFLSFAPSADVKAALVRFDKSLKERYPDVYAAPCNGAVVALRKSHFLLYPLASWAVRRSTQGTSFASMKKKV